MTILFGQVKGSLAFACFVVDTYLFRQKVKEYVDMTTNCCVVDVCIFLRVLFIAVGTYLNQEFNAIVSTILDCKSHKLVPVAVELLVKNIESCVPLVTM